MARDTYWGGLVPTDRTEEPQKGSERTFRDLARMAATVGSFLGGPVGGAAGMAEAGLMEDAGPLEKTLFGMAGVIPFVPASAGRRAAKALKGRTKSIDEQTGPLQEQITQLQTHHNQLTKSVEEASATVREATETFGMDPSKTGLSTLAQAIKVEKGVSSAEAMNMAQRIKSAAKFQKEATGQIQSVGESLKKKTLELENLGTQRQGAVVQFPEEAARQQRTISKLDEQIVPLQREVESLRINQMQVQNQISEVDDMIRVAKDKYGIDPETAGLSQAVMAIKQVAGVSNAEARSMAGRLMDMVKEQKSAKTRLQQIASEYEEKGSALSKLQSQQTAVEIGPDDIPY